MFLKTIFFSLMLIPSTYALLPPTCVVTGFSKQYVKKGNKTRVETINMKLDYKNSSDFVWSYFDFGAEGRLEISVAMKNRSFLVNFKKDNGRMKGFDLYRWVQTAVPKNKRKDTSMFIKFWHNVHSYCTLNIESLAKWK